MASVNHQINTSGRDKLKVANRRSSKQHFGWGAVAVVLLAAALIYLRGSFGGEKRPDRIPPSVPDLSSLLSLPVQTLQQVDLARMNLVCAEGLPGSEDLDVNRSLARLDAMAARVRAETERHYYRFQQNPAEFENSEGYFRMLMLAVVLSEDFQVQYSLDMIGNAADAWLGDGFFADSREVFLHGLTEPKPQGTCSSLPVLQVAVGRRLGYPLKLVTTKGHLFVRWEDSRERFNIEASGKGVNRFSDDYYRHWPLEVSEEEIRAEGYLRSLSAAEEFAVFLAIRAMCLNEAKRYTEAAESFREAARLANRPSDRLMQAELERMAFVKASQDLAAKNPGESKP